MNACSYLTVITEHHSQRAVLRLQGELDASNTDRLRRVISNALQRRPPVLVVDLSELSFTDCAGLSVLVWVNKHQAERGHELVITGWKPIVRRLLQLTGLDTYLHLSTAEALSIPAAPDNPCESTCVLPRSASKAPCQTGVCGSSQRERREMTVPPSGEQFAIAAGDQRATIVIP